MKPASYWRDILCNRFIVNTKESGVIEKFIESVQRDAKCCWLPIETANKNGIILISNGNGTWPCKWDHGRYGEGFYELGKEHCSPVGAPTHWMPLPRLP